MIVDTEEEFDWSTPLSRSNRSVDTIPAQDRAQAIFAEFGIVPTYVVDYPVASSAEAVDVLRGYADSGACEIGAHLHPWVNPPDEEAVTPYNSYGGNLPPDLERRKLARLTEAIEAAFGRRPRVFKAGRYGLGPATPAALEALGYQVDASVVPLTSFTDDGGPDFTADSPFPGRLAGTRAVMELPLTVGLTGRLRSQGARLVPRVFAPAAMRLRVAGVLARSRLLERIRLSPEGAGFDDHRRLTESLLRDGLQVFSYTYHSPSLVPGQTPYVRNAADLHRFLDDMRRYFEHFLGPCGGVGATATEIYQLWRAGRLVQPEAPEESSFSRICRRIS